DVESYMDVEHTPGRITEGSYTGGNVCLETSRAHVTTSLLPKRVAARAQAAGYEQEAPGDTSCNDSGAHKPTRSLSDREDRIAEGDRKSTRLNSSHSQ